MSLTTTETITGTIRSILYCDINNINEWKWYVKKYGGGLPRVRKNDGRLNKVQYLFRIFYLIFVCKFYVTITTGSKRMCVTLRIGGATAPIPIKTRCTFGGLTRGRQVYKKYNNIVCVCSIIDILYIIIRVYRSSKMAYLECLYQLKMIRVFDDEKLSAVPFLLANT